MLKLVRVVVRACVLLTLIVTWSYGQSGKISGTVTDAETGDPLPGVNVVVEGTSQGATTNAGGFYNILNVAPGTYTVRATFVGYADAVRTGVNVNIDLTTAVDFELQEEAVGLDEVTVQASEPVVKADISANVANLGAESMENIPVAGVEEVIGLQAGIEPGMQVRGSDVDQVNFIVDGMSTRDGRDNTSFTGISYTSVEEVQVQTGGFNAEYGNVRSGLINVVTREGPRDHYTADIITRYTPAQKKNFGISPADPEAYWRRSYVDPEVAFVGTDTEESPWDEYTRRQYPSFVGWNRVSEQLNSDDNPNNDLTPEQAQRVSNFRHRKDVEIDTPDFTFDGSIGGPVPVVSEALGDLRFFGSYRQTQDAYVIPQSREVQEDRTAQLKLTSNISPRMKLKVQGIYGRQKGVNASITGQPIMYQGEMPRYPWDGRNTLLINAGTMRKVIFHTDGQNPMDIARSIVGIDFTHTVNQRTFYEIAVKRSYSDYFTRPGVRRDAETVETIGSMELDESPFDWQREKGSDLSGMGLHGTTRTNARDSSNVAVWNANFDVTSQVNRFSQFKTGGELVYSDYHINHGQVDSVFAGTEYPYFRWNRQPIQAAAYAQNKLEFQGMIANVGVRADYFNPRGTWYEYEPWTNAFSAGQGFNHLDENLEQVPTESQLVLSPRMGVSFPITTVSKFFFNYGHFRQMLDPQAIFAIEEQSAGAVGRLGNPNHPLPKTVAYELGYEHNLFSQYLLRITGYYKALSNQPRQVRYVGLGEIVDYTVSEPLNYQDIRGAELVLSKNTGRWFRGFLNFTYMVEKSGNFGLAEYYENRSEQRTYERTTRDHIQNKPVPEPYARFNLEFFSPTNFGPEAGGIAPLSDWRLTFLGEWRKGLAFTWAGGGAGVPGLSNNVRWTDYYNLDMRLAKNMRVGTGDIQLFIDISNALNIKHMYRWIAFEGSRDFTNYMQSLHLPDDAFEGFTKPYAYIPGDDKPGDYRAWTTEFVPIEVVNDLPSEGISRTQGMYGPLYYVQDSGTYHIWEGGSWAEADPQKVDQVLEDKAYIDMPNQRAFTFLNPRRVQFGLRLSF